MSADEGAPYETLTVDKLTPIIGAEIGGVDLPPRSATADRRGPRALAEHPVIFFRDQHLTPKTSTRRSAGSSASCTSIRPRRTRRASRS